MKDSGLGAKLNNGTPAAIRYISMVNSCSFLQYPYGRAPSL
jgi:hypothetical protein